jgi:hypothetical protein
MKEEASQVRRLRKHPIHRFSRHNAFPNREGKEKAASPPKKGSQPRLAALGSSFHRKEVPRRGGGWIGGSGVKKRGGSSQVDDSRKHPLQENNL